MQAVVCCLEAFADVPAVTTPLLKFMSEFVFNKSQRLTFDSSSANGILLFREVSKVLVTYSKHVLSVGQVADVYNDKYKGIWVCLQVRQWHAVVAMLTMMTAGPVSCVMSSTMYQLWVFELYADCAMFFMPIKLPRHPPPTPHPPPRSPLCHHVSACRRCLEP
jgi:hypothetical protein